MQRRRFIQVSMHSCLVGPLATSGVAGAVDPVAVLRDLLAQSLIAAEVGHACLQNGMAEPLAVRHFIAALGDGADSRQMIENRFHERRQNDFANERLLSLNGWQLAESEMLAFAAVASS